MLAMVQRTEISGWRCGIGERSKAQQLPLLRLRILPAQMHPVLIESLQSRLHANEVRAGRQLDCPGYW